MTIPFCIVLTVLVLSVSCSMSGDPRHREEPVRNIWTTVIYMAADNDLESAALADFRELEAGIERPDHTVLVLFDGAGCGDTRLYRVHHNNAFTAVDGPVASSELSCPPLGITAGEANEVDMASPVVLGTFLDYAETAFPAEKFSLIVWGYGNGFRSVTADDTSGHTMPLSHFGKALAGRSLELVGFDTSFGATLEVAYEIKDSTRLIAGFPGMAPSYGWNYTALLNSWNRGAEEFITALESGNGVLIDTQAVKEVYPAFENFCSTLATMIDSETMQELVMNMITMESVRYAGPTVPCDLYLDVCSLALIFDDPALLDVLENSCVASTDHWPGFSVFFTALSGQSVSVLNHPAEYQTDSGAPDRCRFVLETTGWCPSAGYARNGLVDKLFGGKW